MVNQWIDVDCGEERTAGQVHLPTDAGEEECGAAGGEGGGGGGLGQVLW